MLFRSPLTAQLAHRPTATAASLSSDFVALRANVLEDKQDGTNYPYRPNPGAYQGPWTAAQQPNMQTDTQTSAQASVLLQWFSTRLKRIQSALPGAP